MEMVFCIELVKLCCIKSINVRGGEKPCLARNKEVLR